MSLAGRSQERPLNVFGRYLRIACKRKAKELGIPRYSWTRLAQDSGIDRVVITDAVSGVTKRPGQDKIWKLIETLQPDPELEKLICRSLAYSTQAEYEASLKEIDRIEAEEEE